MLYCFDSPFRVRYSLVIVPDLAPGITESADREQTCYRAKRAGEEGKSGGREPPKAVVAVSLEKAIVQKTYVGW